MNGRRRSTSPRKRSPPTAASNACATAWTKVTQGERDLLLRYHQGENNIRNRKALASELGVPLNALRIRVHRDAPQAGDLRPRLPEAVTFRPR